MSLLQMQIFTVSNDQFLKYSSKNIRDRKLGQVLFESLLDKSQFTWLLAIANLTKIYEFSGLQKLF